MRKVEKKQANERNIGNDKDWERTNLRGKRERVCVCLKEKKRQRQERKRSQLTTEN